MTDQDDRFRFIIDEVCLLQDKYRAEGLGAVKEGDLYAVVQRWAVDEADFRFLFDSALVYMHDPRSAVG